MRYNITHNIVGALKILLMLVFFLILLHTGSMILAEHWAFDDALWFSFTTLLTVGYGDFYPATNVGRLATVLLSYIPGIALFSALVGLINEWWTERRWKKVTGQWNWKMKNHIAIIGNPNTDAEGYFLRFLREIRNCPEYNESPVIVLTKLWNDGVPQAIHELGMNYVKGDIYDPTAVDHMNLHTARAVICMANASDRQSDDKMFSLVSRLRDLGVAAPIIVECVEDSDRVRMKAIGASIVVRPMRAYPAMLVTAMKCPGSETIIENMFTSHGDQMKTFPIHNQNITFMEAVVRVLDQDIGLVIAVGFRDGTIKSNVSATMVLSDATSLFVLVRENTGPLPSSIL